MEEEDKIRLTELCDGYINGNISWAKIEAKSFDHYDIAQELIDTFGYSKNKAFLTASHMLGSDCWQAALDAK
jgi:hypothetical protein